MKKKIIIFFWWLIDPSVENCNKITISNEDYKCCFVKIKDDGEKELKCAAMEKVK